MILELRRILCSKTAFGILLAILLLNGILFERQQQAEKFGFSSYTSGVYEMFYGEVGPEEYLRAYDGLYVKYAGTDVNTAITEVQQITQLYESLPEFQTVLDAQSTVTQEEWESDAFANYRLIYDSFLLQYPDAVEAVTDDFSTFRAQVYVDSVAAQKLLAQLEYLQDYPDYLKTVQQNAERLQRFSTLSSGFDGENILKTAADFATLDGVKVQLCRDGALTALFSYRMTDYLLVLLLLYYALCCLRERQDGLWAVIHAMPRGRGVLAGQRLILLLICTVAGALLLYGEILLIGIWLYGGVDLGVAAQSIALFQKYPVESTTGVLLVRFMLLRVLTGFALVAAIWLLLSASRNGKLMLVVLAAVVAVEFSMYELLPPRSLYNVLKYLNVFSLVHIEDLFSDYQNVNLLGHPIGMRTLVTSASLVLAFGLGVSCVLLHGHMRPFGRNEHSWNLIAVLRCWEGAICGRLGGFCLEVYKALVLQHGWAVLLLFVVLSCSMDTTAPVPRTAADDYYAQLQGPITAETQAELAAMIDANDIEMQYADTLQTQWQAGEISFDVYFSQMAKHISAYDRASVLMEVQVRLEHLQELGGEEPLWMLDSSEFDSIFSSYAADVQIRRGLLLLAALCVLCSGLAAMDQQYHMVSLLWTTPNGRRKRLCWQYVWILCVTVSMSFLQSGIEVVCLMGTNAVAYLDAPVQSIAWLEEFPLHVSIWTFIMMMSAYRVISAVCMGCLLYWLSGWFTQIRQAMLTELVLLLGPTMLYYYIGIEPLKWFSAVLPASGVGLLWDSHSNAVWAAVVLALLVSLLITSVYHSLGKIRGRSCI
jgi:hypothetical protein